MRTAAIPAAVLVAALAPNAVAGLYKCVDADGNITYRQTMCPADADDAAIDTAHGAAAASTRDPGAAACDAIRGLATEIARAMQRGLSSTDAVNALGGVGQVDQNALEVIGYVYSFEGQRNTAIGQIAALAAQKCRAGGFSIAAPEPTPASASGGRATGSGFIVNADGAVLTNHHVVDGCRTIRVQHGETWYDARLAHSRSSADLAVVLADGLRGPAAVFNAADQVPVGETVVAAGYPLQGMLARQVNITNGIISATAGIGEDAAVMQMTVPVQPGNSGGPVIGPAGLVEGVTVSKLSDAYTMRQTGSVPQNVNFAVKGAVAKAFLSDTGTAFRSARPEGLLTTTDIAARARGYTVLIDCQR